MVCSTYLGTQAKGVRFWEKDLYLENPSSNKQNHVFDWAYLKNEFQQRFVQASTCLMDIGPFLLTLFVNIFYTYLLLFKEFE